MSGKINDRPGLKVKKRKVLGRKVNSLRKEGLLPANIYGKKIKSLAVETDLVEVKKTFDLVGETGLVDLIVEGEKENRPVLLQNPQFDPVSGQLLHFDFYQVDLTEKITADIPVEVSGQSPAAERGEGILVQLLAEVEVEALPTDLPEKFVVDVSKLDQVDQAVTVASLVKENGIDEKKITVKTAADQLVVKVEPPAKEEVVEEKPAEGEEGLPATEGEEGKEKPAEGEKPAEKESPKEKKEEKPEEKQK